MTSKECIDFLYGQRRVFSKPGLSRIEYMLESVGSPQNKLKYVHVAGTNGKGSCASMVASMLAAGGFKTGLYVSPDISKRFEGIRINGRMISGGKLAELVERIAPAVGELDQKDDSPTAFEMITACVFLWFFLEKCDICVIECGMGGMLDATNVIKDPLACVLMNISIDHVRVLGSTVAEIAANKAGIIKQGAEVICYGNSDEALETILRVCREKGAEATVPDYSLINIKKLDDTGSVFDYKNLRNIRLGLAGLSQIKNCCCALETVFSLARHGFETGETAIKKGLKKVRMPGRFEIFSKDPTVIYDGAHNIGSVTALVENLGKFYPGKKATVVMGVMADKAYGEILAMLKPLINRLVAVTPDNERALDKELLRDEAKALGIEATCAEIAEIGNIIKKANRNDLILVTGSLYIYKDALPHIKNAVRRKEKNMSDKIMTVAIDGPSGAGKSTVAKAISKLFKIGYLDTGAMYRTVALFMDRNIPELEGEVNAGEIQPATVEKIISLLKNTGIEVRYDENNVQHMFLGDEDVSGKIRTPLISMEASKVSAIPEVRVYLVDMQREIGSRNSIVMDGRDIGTHVLKDATVKIYLTASAEERANRRYKELIEKGSEVSYEEVLKNIIDRDYGDTHRASSPLRQAEDAVLLDTTTLSLDGSISAAVEIVTSKTGVEPVKE